MRGARVGIPSGKVSQQRRDAEETFGGFERVTGEYGRLDGASQPARGEVDGHQDSGHHVCRNLLHKPVLWGADNAVYSG